MYFWPHKTRRQKNIKTPQIISTPTSLRNTEPIRITGTSKVMKENGTQVTWFQLIVIVLYFIIFFCTFFICLLCLSKNHHNEEEFFSFFHILKHANRTKYLISNKLFQNKICTVKEINHICNNFFFTVQLLTRIENIKNTY